VKFAFISAEKAQFGVAYLCRQLDVSRSGYYAWCHRDDSERVRADRALVQLVRAEFDRHPRGCGSRPITHALRRRGQPIGRKRVVRLMAQEKLRHRLRRRFARTTDSRHTHRVSGNVVKRLFDVGTPDKVWAGDITYLHTKRGWAYLAALLDLGTRKVVGWKVGPSLDHGLALGAFEMAVTDRRPPPGVVHHSDRGVQYACDAYRASLQRHGFVSSMSRKGDCWDNAVVESFFSTLKRELPANVLEDWQHADRAVFEYIAAYYNSRRAHSTLGYLTPNEYERAVVS
jgi:putative transposase